jgi:chromosome segregation ATPase
MAAPVSSTSTQHAPQVSLDANSLEARMKSKAMFHKLKMNGVDPDAYLQKESEERQKEFQQAVHDYSEQLRARKALCRSLINGVLESIDDRPLDNTLEYVKYLHRQVKHMKKDVSGRHQNIDACRAYLEDLSKDNEKLKTHLQALQESLKQPTRREKQILNFGVAFTSKMSNIPNIKQEK